MSVIIIMIGVGLLSLPAVTTRGSLAPSDRVRLACGAAVAGMALLAIGSLITASPLLLQLHHDLGPTRGAIGHLSPGGPWAWAAGGTLGAVGASRALRAVARAVRGRRRASLPRWASVSAAHDDCAGAEVRVAPTMQAAAFAVPGRDRHVVISRSVAQLPEPERRAVVAHEGAHLRLRHHRHLLVLSVYEHLWGWLPGVRTVIADHRRFVEQWADLDAARSPLVDPLAFERARRTLRPCAHATSLSGAPQGATSSSLPHLAGVIALAAPLIVAGVYSAAHSLHDLNEVIAAAH